MSSQWEHNSSTGKVQLSLLFPGQLTKYFQNAATTLSSTKSKEQEILNKEMGLLMDGGIEEESLALPGGLISRLGMVEVKQHRISEKKKQKAFLRFLFRQVLQNAVNRLEQILDFHQTEMEAIATYLESLEVETKELHMQQEAIRHLIRNFQEKGKIRPNAQGQLINEQAELAILAYEQQYDVQIDRNDPNFYFILLQMQAKLKQQQKEHRLQITQYQEAYDYHKTQYEEALSIQIDLINGNEIEQKRALEKLEQLEQEQQIAISINAITESSNPILQKQLKKTAGLNDEDLEAMNFSFDFPPLHDDFQKSVEVTKDEQGPQSNKPLPSIPK